MKKLTPKEVETLIILSEECAEVSQMCSKILRFGFSSTHPSDPTNPNWKRLGEEIGDMVAMIEFVVELKQGISLGLIESAYNAKKEKLKKYSDFLYDKS
jgi:NTP pyrophosphatase (non-canonical NTP hydrolase)